MSTSVYWKLTCDGLVSRPGGVKNSHPLNTTETGYERRLAVKDKSLALAHMIAHAIFAL